MLTACVHCRAVEGVQLRHNYFYVYRSTFPCANYSADGNCILRESRMLHSESFHFPRKTFAEVKFLPLETEASTRKKISPILKKSINI